jgi:hypothetical protein
MSSFEVAPWHLLELRSEEPGTAGGQTSNSPFLRDFERKDIDRFRASRIQGDVLGDIERQRRFGPWRGCKVRPVRDNFDTNLITGVN